MTNKHTIIALSMLFASAAQLVAAQATPLGPFEVDTSDREAVRQFFSSVYLASDRVPIEWNGDIATCNPGTVNSAYLDATLTRINWFRTLAGVPSNVTFTAENNRIAQATALLMSAKRELSHEPPMDWPCWTADGLEGAKLSNLSGGNTGPAAIDGLVKDGSQVGHRRTMLNPQVVTMGSGSIPGGDGRYASEAQLMRTQDEPRLPARDEYVAWPPKGFVPYQVVYPLWSIVLRDADFAEAQPTLRRRDGSTIPVTVTHRTDFAGPGLVFRIDSLQESCQGRPQPCSDKWARPAADEPIDVTISNVVVNGAARDITYTVTVFDPTVGDAARLAITGPSNPALNQPSTYRVTEFPRATGYEWRTSKLAALEISDAADNGLANFDARVGGYEPVTTNSATGGGPAFRLTTGSPGGVAGSGAQTLTLKRVLIPNANSQLVLKTRARLLDNVTAVAEVSPDGGSSWTTILSKQADDEAGFSEQSPSLAAFAGQHLLLRFRIENAGTGGTFFGGTEGWYIDDVALRSFQSTVDPASTVVTATPEHSFTPTEPGEYDVEVRVQFFASVFGTWSAPLRISPLPAATTPAEPAPPPTEPTPPPTEPTPPPTEPTPPPSEPEQPIDPEQPAPELPTDTEEPNEP